MPVEVVRKDGKIVGYRWGKHGKLYTGKGARSKAAKQGRAIKASEGRRK